MNSKGHLYVSVAKSFSRIAACMICISTGNIDYLAAGFLVAELLGIAEELVDFR